MRSTLLAVLLAAAVGAGWLASSWSAQRAIPERQLDALEQRVHDYLLENPEVIMQALQVLQERRRAAEAEDFKATLAAHRDDLVRDPDAPVAGNPLGDATIVQFFDYNCPYCRRVAPTVRDLIERDPGLRVVYKEMPILGPGSHFAARAALASRAQGKYLEFHEALMNAREQVGEDSVIEIARQVGLDIDRLAEDMNDPTIEAAIGRNLDLAGALGIAGTPTFVIDDGVVRGAVDRITLESHIARVRRGS